jgi:hypothetical protein
LSPDKHKVTVIEDPNAKKYSEDLEIKTNYKGFKVLGNAEKRPLPKRK